MDQLVYIRFLLSNEFTFHVYFLESSFNNQVHIGVLAEVDAVLRNFKILEHTKTPVNMTIFAPIVKLPLFFAKNEQSGMIIVYPYETYGKIPHYLPQFNPYLSNNFRIGEIKIKSF